MFFLFCGVCLWGYGRIYAAKILIVFRLTSGKEKIRQFLDGFFFSNHHSRDVARYVLTATLGRTPSLGCSLALLLSMIPTAYRFYVLCILPKPEQRIYITSTLGGARRLMTSCLCVSIPSVLFLCKDTHYLLIVMFLLMKI